MPEGPEIHRAADKIARAISDKQAEEVFFAFEELQPWQERLAGRKIEGVEARGKAILTWFTGELAVYSHNQLYGRWYIKPRGKLAKTNRSLRFAVHGPKKSALLYSASQIEVLSSPEEIAAHGYLSGLGPDPLRGEPVEERVQEERFFGRSLGALLLDQGFVAGVGNYLRSEALHAIEAHPSVKLGDLDGDARRRLGQVLEEMMERSYESGGLTTSAEHVEAARERGLTRKHYRHYVFARAGSACPRCGETIVKEHQSGRRVYRCPGCQPAP